MDLKSMLNDSAARPPPSLHTPHSSYDARAAEKHIAHESQLRSQSHTQSGRPVPYPPPLQPVDSRAQSAGGYFGTQSPHPNQISSASSHVSTPSAGPHSVYARSPGGQSQSYTPRETAPPPNAYNSAFVPSPSLSINQPLTPGSVYHHQNHTPLSAHSQTSHPSHYAQAQSPRGSNPTNGPHRQISPNTPHSYPQPATPLGPPIHYNKISPSAQRPPSQGIDQHYRKSSYGSVGSAPGRDHNSIQHQPPDNTQRQTNPDLERVRERERSVSVSPKTIPQPSPFRPTSVSSQAGSQGRPSIQSPSETRAMSNISDVQVGAYTPTGDIKSEHQQTPTPRASTIPSEPPQPPSRGPSIKEETHDTISPIPPPTLKRHASSMSDQSHASQMQPRKRLKRDEIPLFARNARDRPLKLGSGKHKVQQNRPAARPPRQAPQQPPQAPVQQSIQQTPQLPLQNGPAPIPNGRASVPAEVAWEPTIANIVPYEDLSRRVCDWIYQKIGGAVPPSGGAMFEIEAKIGEIFDIKEGRRLRLPVDTETILKKDGEHYTKFESSMNMEQHMLINKYLNDLTRDAFLQAQKGERSEIVYDHPHEVDEFFDLEPEGKRHLNPSIQLYLEGKRTPRVRRTIDRNTGQVKAQIIKTRIADLEIYNPNTDFDCRISISIESPWEGDNSWLRPSGDGNRGRHKDRMSYRHMAYQVDLTQVSYDDKPEMEHELEIEISTEQIRREIDNLQNQRPSKYEDLVKGLIDNVRLLCRKASISGPRRLI